MLSTRLASVSLSEAGEDAPPSFHSLPRPLKAIIFLLLPMDTRLRCTEVCHAWRALLADTYFWERLNFCDVDPLLRQTLLNEALFVAAVAKANGQLRELDVSKYITSIYDEPCLSHAASMRAVAANSKTLLRLRLCSGYCGAVPNTVAELCALAPGLQKLEASVLCLSTEARALLRREPPFGVLHLSALNLNFTDGDEENALLSCLADIQLHGACLDELDLYRAPMPGHAAWNALADTAICVGLAQVAVTNSLLGPWCVPGLARLLRESSISSIQLYGDSGIGGPILDAETEPVLSAALRANSTLTHIVLRHAGLWDQPAGIDFVDSFVGHPTLKIICLQEPMRQNAETRPLAAAALGRLVAANSSALEEIKVSDCALGDDGLRPLFAALPSNTHLQTLSACDNGVTVAFAPFVLASVKANRSLQMLFIDGQKQNGLGYGEESIGELRDAEALVDRRSEDRIEEFLNES